MVHYLCHPPRDSLNFVYASELPANYYAPGQFCIEAANRGGRPYGSYSFLARFQGELVEQRLELISSRTFSVTVFPIAQRFFFKAVSFNRTARYIGDEVRWFSDVPLMRLQPASDRRLEAACQEYDFYFVGFGGQGSSLENEF